VQEENKGGEGAKSKKDKPKTEKREIASRRGRKVTGGSKAAKGKK